jgi:hypothetical protein
MALYKFGKYLNQSDGDAFDKLWNPGETPEHSGIYRCTGCGREVVAEHERKLPPQNHHQHPPGEGNVRWKLIVYADGRSQ